MAEGDLGDLIVWRVRQDRRPHRAERIGEVQASGEPSRRATVESTPLPKVNSRTVEMGSRTAARTSIVSPSRTNTRYSNRSPSSLPTWTRVGEAICDQRLAFTDYRAPSGPVASKSGLV